MHMADALLNPAVGTAFWITSAVMIGVASKKSTQENDAEKIPLMGVLGAFIFAAQMINFTIPGTGSSGHLGGGLILTILLGPWRAFLTLASVLTIQCLFFADGGILALGANIFNLAFWPAFMAYPLIFKPMAGENPTPVRLGIATVLAAVVGLQLGSFSVVMETVMSGISDLPFTTFVLTMQPIHLAIGVVEGLVTFAVISYVRKVQPSLMTSAPTDSLSKSILVTFTLLIVLVGGFVSWFASSQPDGLEWSMGRTSGKEELEVTTSIQKTLAGIQEKLAFLPDYGFKTAEIAEKVASEVETTELASSVSWGTTVSGLVGPLMVLLLAMGVGFILRRKGSEHDHGHTHDHSHPHSHRGGGHTHSH